MLENHSPEDQAFYLARFIYRDTEMERYHCQGAEMDMQLYAAMYQIVSRNLRTVLLCHPILLRVTQPEDILAPFRAMSPQKQRELMRYLDSISSLALYRCNWDSPQRLPLSAPPADLAQFILEGHFLQCCRQRRTLSDATMRYINRDVYNRIFTLLSAGFLTDSSAKEEPTMTYTCTYASPLGEIVLASDGAALTGLWFAGQKYFPADASLFQPVDMGGSEPLAQAVQWLDAYFAGRDPGFTPPLRPAGTPFRQQVWNALLEIPYGQTTTYGALARRLSVASAQAVGGAVGHNPISLIIPCHRVVGSSGSLTGYAGGIERKEALLRLEGVDLSSLFRPRRGSAL